MDILRFLSNTFKLYAFDDKAYEDIIKNFNYKDILVLYLIFSFFTMLIPMILVDVSLISVGYMIGVIVFIPILILLFLYISGGLFHFFIKLFGGKADLNSFFKVLIAVAIPMQIFNFVYNVFNYLMKISVDNVSIISNIIFSILMLCFYVYALIVGIRYYAKVHKTGCGAVIGAMVVVLILLLLIVVVISLLFFSFFMIASTSTVPVIAG